jgi:phosphoglycolate phosphatase
VVTSSFVKKSILLLWDIDGTLIVSHGAGVRAMERALTRRFGLTCDLGQIDWAGRTDTWITGEVLRHVGLPDTPENSRAYLDTYLELLPQELRSGPPGQVLPGVADLLAALAQRDDVAQGLLTGNLRRGAEHKLTHHGLWHYFAFGAFADDSPRRNDLGPHALRRAREHHGRDFSPADTWIIGDTPHDIACGQAIGARTLAVATGQFDAAALGAHRPCALLPSLARPDVFLRTVGLA